MKIIVYYLLLLVLIALTGGYLLSGDMRAMSMPQMLSVTAALVVYTILMSLIGETNNIDERDILHRNLANRAGLIAGNVVFSLGLIYQMFVTHELDWWLLAGLIAVNLTKIVSLIYLNYRK
ncbi:MAG: hypothetical protein HYZ51_00950 [Candidatus Doudnabacteria bacterium]|nr:hypothetical protein [Candidatus Doudnabacteria bacterium]